MCDSVADYYSRIIGCSVKCQPPRPTLNSFAWRHASSLPPGCNSGISEPQVTKKSFSGWNDPHLFLFLRRLPRSLASTQRSLWLIVRRSSIIFILSAPGNRCHCCTIIPSRLYLGPKPSFFGGFFLRTAGLLLAAAVNAEFTFGKDVSTYQAWYWFLCCWDPFTKSVEREMNWYKTNKTLWPNFCFLFFYFQQNSTTNRSVESEPSQYSCMKKHHQSW